MKAFDPGPTTNPKPLFREPGKDYRPFTDYIVDLKITCPDCGALISCPELGFIIDHDDPEGQFIAMECPGKDGDKHDLCFHLS